MKIRIFAFLGCALAVLLAPSLVLAAETRGMVLESKGGSKSAHGATAPVDSAVAAPKTSHYTNTWIVVVGINQYTHEGIPDLNYAVADADAIAKQMATTYSVPKGNVLVLYDGNATRANILRSLSALRDPERVSENDRVIVFFAGHGETVPLPRGGALGYLVPVDADPSDLVVTGISMDELKRASSYIPAKHVLFLVDSCYSGIAGTTRGMAPVQSQPNLVVQRLLGEPSRQMITAGGKGEKVVEDERWGHSVFTHSVLKGLEGFADGDSDGNILTSELFAFVRGKVIRDAAGAQNPQFYTLEGEGELVFESPQGGKPVAVAAPANAGTSGEPTGRSDEGKTASSKDFTTLTAVNQVTVGGAAEPSKPVYKKAWFWILMTSVVAVGVGAVLCNPTVSGGSGGSVATDGGTATGGSGGSFACQGPGAYGSGLTYALPMGR